MTEENKKSERRTSSGHSSIIAVKYFLFFGVMFVLANARIDSQIAPFALSFLFASIFLSVKPWAAAAVFFLSELYMTNQTSQVISALAAVCVFALFLVLIKRFPDFKSVTGAVIAYIIANGYALAQLWTVREYFYGGLVSVIIGSVFLGVTAVLINAVKIKRTKIPWTVDQKICAAVFVTVFALGLSGLDTEYFSSHKLVSIYIILVGVYMFDTRSTLVIAVCLGLGQSLAALNLNYVAVYTLLCAVAMAFKSRNTAYSVIALIFTDIVLGTYFNAYIVYNFYAFLPVILAVCAFMLTPQGLAKRFDFAASSLNGNLVSKNTINKNRAGIYSQLNSLANVFAELQNIYRSLIHAETPAGEAKLLLSGQMQTSLCENCVNKANCYRDTKSGEDIRESFAALAYIALSRGTVNFLDIPGSLTVRCIRINSVVSTTNNLLKERNERETALGKLDMGKILMAQLLSGLSKLMVRFASDVCSAVVFDNDTADLIKEELLYRSIVASDCLITRINLNEYTISVLVSRIDSKNRAIEQVISRVLKHKMQLESIDDAENAGFAIVTVKTAPQYQMLFGVAQVSKNYNQASGDIYSFLKISHDKSLMAICDGMGAGASAEKAATLALSLVENFYKAGFPNEMIMMNVNQLLQISAGDIFSALDIAVFNFGTGEADFVKVGASDGFIKRRDTVEVVEAGSLPLGILEEMQPKITHAVLAENDIVILVSDGVSDAFSSRVTLANFINNLMVDNPQELADTIMDEALNRSGRIARDDYTVAVGKLAVR